MKTFAFFAFALIFSSWYLLLPTPDESTITIYVDSNLTDLDSLYITEFGMDKVIAKIPVNQSGTQFTFQLDYPSAGSIHTKFGEDKKPYLTTLTKGKTIKIKIDADSTISTFACLSDSLLNYLLLSQNQFIAENANFIFTSPDTDSTYQLLEDFRVKRKQTIQKYENQLTEDELDLLLYQSDARMYSFMFYYARNVKDFPPEHTFFNFINQIDDQSIWLKTLAQNVVYKYEIEYLHQNDSITSIDSFLDFITTPNPSKRSWRFYQNGLYPITY